MSRARVLLADDHRIVLEGLKSVLAEGFEVIGTVEDGHALAAAARTLKPDIIVTDIAMPRMTGIEAIGQLRKDNPEVKIVVLTMHQDEAYARRAFEAGAHGFVTKHSAVAELVVAIHAVLNGQKFISTTLKTGCGERRRNQPG